MKYNPMKLTEREWIEHLEHCLLQSLTENNRLREAAHRDALTIQRLRREIDQWAAIAEDTQAKLARFNQLATSRVGRVTR